MNWTGERTRNIMIRRQKIAVIALIVLALILEGCAGLYMKREETLQILPDEIPREVSHTFKNAEKAFKEGQSEQALALYREILSVIPRGKGEIIIDQIDWESGLKMTTDHTCRIISNFLNNLKIEMKPNNDMSTIKTNSKGR